MASVNDWSTTASSNTSVGGLTTDGNVQTVNNIDNMFRGLMAEVATSRDDGTIINVYPRGYINGLTLSNNAGDITNDIDIAGGECVALNSPYWRMALGTPITKRLDAAWAVGTGNGGLDTGAIANTTYHVWLIQRSDTSVVDALFSTSASSPTMPANYDRKRRIGSIVRASAAIRVFRQVGDIFNIQTPVTDRNSTSAAAGALITVSVPLGIVVRPIFRMALSVGAAGSSVVNFLGDAAAGSANVTVMNVVGSAAGAAEDNVLAPVHHTNTSAQVYFAASILAGTIANNSLFTYGWIDSRGREA